MAVANRKLEKLFSQLEAKDKEDERHSIIAFTTASVLEEVITMIADEEVFRKYYHIWGGNDNEE